MARVLAGTSPLSAGTFGELLHYLRRRLQLTQRDLGLAVGYSEAQISRLEKNYRHAPDLTTLVALFVPALHLEDEPDVVARLLELAADSRGESLAGKQVSYEQRQVSRADTTWSIEPPPPSPPSAVTRGTTVTRMREHLRLDGALTVLGLPGMGKTTLTAEIARHAAKTGPVCWLMIRPGVNDTAAAVVRYLAAFLFANGRDEVEAMLVPAHDAGTLALERSLALVAGACRALGEPLVCIDNAHLLLEDPAGVKVLRHLATLPAIRLLLTSRVELPLEGIRQEWLEGLTPDEGRALLERLCPDLAPDLAQALLERVAGSPILIRLAAGQLRSGAVEARRFIDTLATQPQIAQYLMESVLGQLSQPARDLMQLIAVFRRPVDVLDAGLADLIRDPLAVIDIAAAIDELQRRNLVPHPAQAALHPLLRDRIATHLATDARTRRRLHRVAMIWFERQHRDPLEAGYHAVQAGEWGHVAELLADQAERLLHQGQAFPAADLIGQALAHVTPEGEPDLTRRLLIGRGDLLVNSERAGQADSDYRAALALTQNATVRAHIIAKLAISLTYRGHAGEALQLAQAAVAELSPADTLLHAQLAAVLCAAQMSTGQYQEADESGMRALRFADQIAPVAPREADAVRAQTHNSLGALKHVRGQPDEAIRHWNASAAAARRARLERLEGRAVFNLGGVYFTRGDLENALAHYQRALSGFERSGDTYLAARALGGLGTVHYLRCELDESLDAHTRALAMKQESSDTVGGAHTQGQMTRILLALGRLPQARAQIELGLGAAHDLGPSRHRAGLFVILSEVQLCAGEVAAAIATLEDVRQFGGLAQEPWFLADWQTHMAAAEIAAGQLDAARERVSDPAADSIGGDVTLERHLVRALLALASGDAAGARKQTVELEAAARAAGNQLLARRAAHLSPDPRALWGKC